MLSPSNRFNSNGDTTQNNICGTIKVTPKVGVTISGNLSLTSDNYLYVDNIVSTASNKTISIDGGLDTPAIYHIYGLQGTDRNGNGGAGNLTISSYDNISFTAIHSMSISPFDLSITTSTIYMSAGDTTSIHSGSKISISAPEIELGKVTIFSIDDANASHESITIKHASDNNTIFNQDSQTQSETLVTANAIKDYLSSVYVPKSGSTDLSGEFAPAISSGSSLGKYTNPWSKGYFRDLFVTTSLTVDGYITTSQLRFPYMPSSAYLELPNPSYKSTIVAVPYSANRTNEVTLIFCGHYNLTKDDEIAPIYAQDIGFSHIYGGIACIGNTYGGVVNLGGQSINEVGCSHTDTTFYIWVDRYDTRVCNRIYYMIWGI